MKSFNKSAFANLVGLLIVIYLGSLLIQTIKRNYSLKQQIDQLEEEIVRLDGEREELSYRIEYYKTEAFKEKEARAKLGLQMPGESIIIFPPAQEDPSQDKTKKAPPKSNLQQWIDFLLGRV